jgi:hypothetical protein
MRSAARAVSALLLRLRPRRIAAVERRADQTPHPAADPAEQRRHRVGRKEHLVLPAGRLRLRLRLRRLAPCTCVKQQRMVPISCGRRGCRRVSLRCVRAFLLVLLGAIHAHASLEPAVALLPAAAVQARVERRLHPQEDWEVSPLRESKKHATTVFGSRKHM